MTLDCLVVGKTARIVRVGGYGVIRHRLLEMGLTPKTIIMVRKKAPMGDPIQIFLRGYELTIRLGDARNVEIVEV